VCQHGNVVVVDETVVVVEVVVVEMVVVVLVVKQIWAAILLSALMATPVGQTVCGLQVSVRWSTSSL